ncbi:MAG: hypothetical protein NVS1B1_02530 [Candidatus Limnocylindrales bacterium]
MSGPDRISARADRWIAAALAVAVALSRLPFASRELATWDSVLLARALDLGFATGTDLADQRPQAPGYIFYVGTGALLRAVFGSPNAAFVAVSIIASALTVASIYLFTLRFGSRGAALVAAGLYATAPLTWSFSEVAMPYAVLGFFSTLLATLFWSGRHGSAAARIGASLGYGLATGFRQDLVLLLAPLWLWMIWPRPREWIPAGAAAAVGALAWLAPSAFAAGGIGAYLSEVDVQSGRAAGFSVAARGAVGLSDNMAMIVYSLGWALAVAAPVLLVVGLARLVARRPVPDARALFFALWIVPPLLFYAVVHIGVSGYILSVVPAFAVLTGLLFDAARRTASGARRRIVTGIAAGAIIANGLIFVATPAPFSAAAIAEHDRSLQERVGYIRAHYPTDATVILAQFEFVFLAQYLPEYRALFFGPGPETLSTDPPEVTIGPGTETVLLFGKVPALPDGDTTPLLPGLVRLTRGGVHAYDIRMR